MTTGMVRPAIAGSLVRALNCLQNSMMLTCAWPSAGPTGGAGVALPASICNFTWVCTFLIGGISDKPFSSNYFFNLAKLELDRGRPAEDGDHYLQRLAVLVDFVDHAVEIGERSVGD